MLTTTDTIKQQSQHLAKLERQLARLKTQQRKEATRHKILLGGLVMKAKLNKLSLEAFYEKLLELKKRVEAEPGLIKLYQYKGESVFMGFQSKTDWITDEKLLFLNFSIDKLKYMRQQTCKKIQFGGLIIKAELPLTTKAEILGAFVSLREELKNNNNV